MGKAGERKSIFITGGASGIGAETARLFASKGWFVGLFDIDQAGLERVLGEIGSENAMLAPLDVTRREDWTRAVGDFSEATGGKMSVLFNNAGIGRHGWFEDVPPAEADAVIDVNIKGVVNGVYAALPLLRATDGARIINTASVAGLVGSPRLAVYSASKFAVRGFSEALDAEFSGLGIRVTCLMPWFVDTPILSMAEKDGSNRHMKDELEASGADVYPVSMAAEMAWEAAHGTESQYLVGKRARQARFISRFFPRRLQRQLKKSLPPR